MASPCSSNALSQSTLGPAPFTVVGRNGDIAVARTADLARTGSAPMMMRKRTKRSTVDRVSRVASERLWRGADWVLALALAASAEYEVWVQSLGAEGVPAPHAVHAVFMLLVTVPLAWRRRAPLLVLCVVVGSAVLEG